MMTPKMLKTAYALDAITCALVFIGGAAAGPAIASLTGLPLGIVQIGAWICLPVALLLAWLSRQNTPPVLPANAVVIGNLGWVAASFAVLAIYYQQLTAIGMVIVTAQALAVLVFALLERAGMQQSTKAIV